MNAHQDFIHTFKSQNHLVQHNKQHHRKVLLSSGFHLNCHTAQFLSTHSKVRITLCNTITAPQESTAQQLSLEWSHLRISSTDSKVRTTLYSTISSTIVFGHLSRSTGTVYCLTHDQIKCIYRQRRKQKSSESKYTFTYFRRSQCTMILINAQKAFQHTKIE